MTLSILPLTLDKTDFINAQGKEEAASPTAVDLAINLKDEPGDGLGTGEHWPAESGFRPPE